MIQINKLDIAKKMKAYCVKGVSVSIIKEDKLASVNNYGVIHNNLNLPVDDMSVFNACSISKIATTLLTLKLVSDGLLHLDKNVNDQMKSWKVSENEYTKTSKVTLRSLLCH